MKNFIFIALAFTCVNAFSQVRVVQGDNSLDLMQNKRAVFTSFSNADADYFVLCHTERFLKVNTLVATDKNGTVTIVKNIMPKMSMFTSFDIKNLLVVGKTPVLFVQTRDKKTGKNTLTASGIDNAGNLDATGIPVASFDFTKMGNAGDWYTALTPDKHHVAVLFKAPHEKDVADHFKYFIEDENMKEVSKGEFTFAGGTKEIYVDDFLASDKGDLYLLSHDSEQDYQFPILYKYAAGQASIIPVTIADQAVKSLNYIFKVNPAGDLIIAGYTQKKAGFTVGDIKATGSWLFNSSKPNEVKTFSFDKPVTNLTARNIVFNGDTFYLVGEAYKADKQQSNATGFARMNAEPEFVYNHNDIMVTGYSNDGNKKFDIPISRSMTTRNNDNQLMIASGVVNGKLALVYNEQYNKYINDPIRRGEKLPLAVSITNDGLMEAPVLFDKDLDIRVSSYILTPEYFSENNGKLVLLNINSQSVKTATFR
jgi:hypothetical protein